MTSFLGMPFGYVRHIYFPAIQWERVKRYLVSVRRPLRTATLTWGFEICTRLLPSSLLIQTPCAPERTDAKVMRFPSGEY